MLLATLSSGRGTSAGQVCEAASKIGRIEGNVFHGNGRFGKIHLLYIKQNFPLFCTLSLMQWPLFCTTSGTYTLNSNYPKSTDQSLGNDGRNTDQTLCEGFDEDGNTRGLSTAFQNNLDYQNDFVGHYNAGDIQYNGHQSYNNLQLIYWKETKNFENGCSAHITGGSFASGNMA
jgi:hypothetical protein